MLSLRIAFRYLRAKKSHTAVNVITLIAVIGVAIATMAMVLVLSIFNGFSDVAVSQFSNLDPDLSIVSSEGKVMTNADSVALKIKGLPGVKFALPTLTDRALLVNESSRIPVIVKGVPPLYDQATRIEQIMLAGEYAVATSDGVPAMQLSVGIANRINAKPSATDRLQLFVPRRHARINPANPTAAFRQEDVAFSGVFRVGNADIDGEYVLLPLEASRDLFDYDNEASAIEVTAEGGVNVENLREQLVELLGDRYKVLSRIEQHPESFRMISIEKWVTFMMLICILIITLFNVVSTLSLLAIEKKDNMRTLKALGAPESMTRNVFIAEGFMVTTLGGFIGIVAGVILALIQQIFHVIKLSGDAASLTIDYYPVRLEINDILVVIVVVVALAMIVGAVSRLIVKTK